MVEYEVYQKIAAALLEAVDAAQNQKLPTLQQCNRWRVALEWKEIDAFPPGSEPPATEAREQ